MMLAPPCWRTVHVALYALTPAPAMVSNWPGTPKLAGTATVVFNCTVLKVSVPPPELGSPNVGERNWRLLALFWVTIQFPLYRESPAPARLKRSPATTKALATVGEKFTVTLPIASC